MPKITDKFPEQEKPLYCFKLIEDDFSIRLDKYIITQYAYRDYGNYSDKADYRFPGEFVHSKFGISAVRASKLDRIVNDRLYTFTIDEETATNMFEDYLKSSFEDSEAVYRSAKKRYQFWQFWQQRRK